MNTFKTMLKIEGRLSIKDMNMVIFALLMPVIILIILGMVYGDKPAFEGADYSFLTQSFGALCTISICAGGLMGLPILVADYREHRILKRFKVTPISPVMILIVQLFIYSIYALLSMIILGIISYVFFNFSIKGSLVLFLGGWFLVLISMLSIGMFVGGIAKNTQQATLISCILYFPMLIFSGATLPYEIMPKGLQIIADIMPLTHGIKMLKSIMLGFSVGQVYISMSILVFVAVIFSMLSIKFFRWE